MFVCCNFPIMLASILNKCVDQQQDKKKDAIKIVTGICDCIWMHLVEQDCPDTITMIANCEMEPVNMAAGASVYTVTAIAISLRVCEMENGTDLQAFSTSSNLAAVDCYTVFLLYSNFRLVESLDKILSGMIVVYGQRWISAQPTQAIAQDFKDSDKDTQPSTYHVVYWVYTIAGRKE